MISDAGSFPLQDEPSLIGVGKPLDSGGRRPLLDGVLRSVEGPLPGWLQRFYLHGSIALGAFDESLSNPDLIAV